MPVDSIKAFLKICSPSLIPACRFTRGNTVTKNFEKSLGLANFVNFADIPQGVGVPPPYW